MKRWLTLLGSLRMAVPLIVVIAAVLAWGTIYETRFGTASVQRFVYQSWWFQALLAFLAVNLAIAAGNRWPWQRKHTPFLLAHLGIILMLTGGIIGGRFGIDGQLIIPEGQSAQILETQQNVLVVEQPNPGSTHIFPTQFETTAWRHEPHTLFHAPSSERPIDLVVDRYYPNAVMTERIAGDGPTENPAVELVMSHEGEEERVWLLAREPERFGVRWGELHVLFVAPATADEYERLLHPDAHPAPPRGVITLKLPEEEIERTIPVPEDFSRAVPVEGTPYTVTFKDYFPDFAITAEGVASRSDQPNNPAISFTLNGPDIAEPFLAFALHPDFEMMHNRERKIHVHVTYTHGAMSELPPQALTVIQPPSGDLTCIWTGPIAERQPVACAIGATLTHPWLQYAITLQTWHPRATVVPEFTNRSDDIRAEAVHVVASDGQTRAESWLGLRGQAALALGGHPVIVGYRPAQREVPFSVKLIDFRKIDYPGTQMAAGFESDVELTDPSRGVTLKRKISMNNPMKYRGYSLFQSSFAPGPPETTILSVRNDPGTPLVYTGFLIIVAGMVSMFVLRAKSARPRGMRAT